MGGILDLANKIEAAGQAVDALFNDHAPGEIDLAEDTPGIPYFLRVGHPNHWSKDMPKTIGPREQQLRDMRAANVKAKPASHNKKLATAKKIVAATAPKTALEVGTAVHQAIVEVATQQPTAPAAAQQETAMRKTTTAKKITPGQKALSRPAPARKKAAAAKRPAKAARSPARAAAPDPGKKQTRYDWNGTTEAAKAGKLPPEPNFKAACNAPYRERLVEITKMANDGDAKGLKKLDIPTYNSIVKVLGRYRDLCVTAIEAKT